MKVFKFENRNGSRCFASLKYLPTNSTTLAVDCDSFLLYDVIRGVDGCWYCDGERIYMSEIEPSQEVEAFFPTVFKLATQIMSGAITLYFDKHYDTLQQ